MNNYKIGNQYIQVMNGKLNLDDFEGIEKVDKIPMQLHKAIFRFRNNKVTNSTLTFEMLDQDSISIVVKKFEGNVTFRATSNIANRVIAVAKQLELEQEVNK